MGSMTEAPPAVTAEEERFEDEFPEEAEGDFQPDTSDFESPDDEGGSGLSDGLTIRGDGQVSLIVGGATPDLSVAKLKGKSISILGNLRKGEELDLTVSVRVGEVKFTDKIDSEGEVIETKRTHVLEVVSIDRRDLD